MESVSALVIAMIAVILVYVIAGLRIVKEHEQGLVMRFGRFYEAVPAGLQLLVPGIDRLRRVDLRTLVVEERIDPSTGSGKVRIFDESWPARSFDGGEIAVGTPIKVMRLEDQFVIVTKSYS